jgi:hypothetical protein
MKTTALFFSFLISLAAYSQSKDVAQSPTPPVPGHETTIKDTTGETVIDPNETVSEANKGTIKTAHVYFIEPKDGATVPRTFTVKMGVEGFKIRPAGEDPDDMTSGHFHIVIDGKPTPAGKPLPMVKNTLHFGKGQTETTLSLKPGPHTLILQFGDGAHRSFGPKMSQTITVIVK